MLVECEFLLEMLFCTDLLQCVAHCLVIEVIVCLSPSAKKTLKCCCTSRMLNLFVLVRIFPDFAHARNLCAHALNSVHTCPGTHAHEIVMSFITQKTQAKTLKITFFNWMTLAFDLWPSNSSKWFSRDRHGQLTDRHRHTHRRLCFYNLYRWRER